MIEQEVAEPRVVICLSHSGTDPNPKESEDELLAAEVGGAVLEVMPSLKVKLDDPEITVRIELRETNAYVHAGAVKGAGGFVVAAGEGVGVDPQRGGGI